MKNQNEVTVTDSSGLDACASRTERNAPELHCDVTTGGARTDRITGCRLSQAERESVTPDQETTAPDRLPALAHLEGPRIATISTAHVSEADQKIIAGLCWSNDTESGEHWILSTKYGWVFCLDRHSSWETELAYQGISTHAIFNLKRVADCGFEWINLEACGDVQDALYQWDW